MNLQARLRQYLNSKSLTFREFERMSGMATASAARLNKNSRKSTFDRIGDAFPDLNINWLLTGEGTMTTGEPVQTTGNVQGHNISGVNVNGRDIHFSCPEVCETLLSIAKDNKAMAEKYQAMTEKYQAQLDKAQQQIDELIALLKSKI